ncbi:hypothetical protein [Marivita sp.]|uniref:hypothetical protein n=1 Tax=Marivita sp. TaxID=2003365 RepID=UPI003F6B3808
MKGLTEDCIRSHANWGQKLLALRAATTEDPSRHRREGTAIEDTRTFFGDALAILNRPGKKDPAATEMLAGAGTMGRAALGHWAQDTAAA